MSYFYLHSWSIVNRTVRVKLNLYDLHGTSVNCIAITGVLLRHAFGFFDRVDKISMRRKTSASHEWSYSSFADLDERTRRMCGPCFYLHSWSSAYLTVRLKSILDNLHGTSGNRCLIICVPPRHDMS